MTLSVTEQFLARSTVIAALIGIALTAAAAAQVPGRPITIIVPFTVTILPTSWHE